MRERASAFIGASFIGYQTMVLMQSTDVSQVAIDLGTWASKSCTSLKALVALDTLVFVNAVAISVQGLATKASLSIA